MKKIGIGSRQKLDSDSSNYSGTFMTDGYSICFLFNKVTGRNVDVPVEPIAPAEEPPLSVIHPDGHITIKLGQLKRKSDRILKESISKFKKMKFKPKKLSANLSALKKLEDLKISIQAIGLSQSDKVYGLDPGKRDLITAVAGIGKEKYATISLSAKEFYHNAGHHKCTKAR